MRDEVVLEADNGRVRARFDRAGGWLTDLDAAFVPAAGQDTIRAEARFAPHPGEAPVLIAHGPLEQGVRVAHLDQLSGGSRPAPRALDPDSAFTTLEGSRVPIRSLAGEIVVLEFWATWCAPCRGTIPQVMKFAAWAKDSAHSVRVILVNTEEEDRDAATLSRRLNDYLGSLAVAGPTLVDAGSVIHRSLGGGLPLTVVMERGGRIIETHGGYRPDLDEVLRRRMRVLAGPDPAPLPPEAVAAASEPQPKVRVIAEEMPGRFGGATYRYVVINDAGASISSVLIGFDQAAGVAELVTPPIGWDGAEAPPTSSTSPDAWHFSITRTEEDSLINLVWEVDDASQALWSGGRLSGLSITLPREDSLYETAHWSAIFNTGPRASLSGRLERTPHRRSSVAEDDPGIHVKHDAKWGSASIEYEMDDTEDVEVAILGEGATVVRKLFRGEAHVGKNKAAWDGLDERGRGVTPGTYFVRVKSATGERFARFSWLR
jgi:thiol-disulfide isomerase/thioredoxin